MESDNVFVQIDSWYARAPEGMSDNDVVRWVQHHSEIPCPSCGDPLWVLRTSRAQNRGMYHLAMCQRPECTYQVDD